MKRKITLLARGLNIGSLGASGFLNAVSPSAATVCRAKKSPPRSEASATEAKPLPACHSISRRVRRQNCPAGGGGVLIAGSDTLVEVDEFIEVEQHQAQHVERALRAQAV